MSLNNFYTSKMKQKEAGRCSQDTHLKKKSNVLKAHQNNY